MLAVNGGLAHIYVSFNLLSVLLSCTVIGVRLIIFDIAVRLVPLFSSFSTVGLFPPCFAGFSVAFRQE